MASALLKEISDDFLTCQICLETFRRPKILDCVHSFCEECLKEYVKPGETEVKCPTCQRGTALKQDGGVSGLKDNFFILNLVETIGARKKVQHSVDRVPCDSCGGTEEAVVVSRCLTCNDFLCESCVASHRTLKVFKGHLVVSLDELRTGRYDGQTEKQEPTCDTHAGEKMRFYCKTDGVPVCRDCIVLDHPKPGHNVVNLADITNELRTSCQTMVTELQQALGSTEDAVKTVDKSMEVIRVRGKKAEQLVDEKVSHLVTFIKKLGEQCKGKVEATCRQEEKQQYAEKERLELKKVRLSSTQELLQTLLSRGTGIEVASAFSQIRKCRDELCTVEQVQSTATTEAGTGRDLLQGTEEWETLVAISGKAFGTPTSQPGPDPYVKATAVGQRRKGRETRAPMAPERPPPGATVELKGNQPPGLMDWYTSHGTGLPGYVNCGTIVISYNFPDGIQGPEHPNPGRPYKGNSWKAYLPNNKEGRDLVQLLKRAFDKRLVFTIRTCLITTGATDTVIWNDIQHKTSILGGVFSDGYPDPEYLTRLRKQLAAKGIK
ncbi:E3 ubiquitin-protein ligase TRIM71-like [Branchiostoma floridae x Branchiostoma belcheri]